MALPRPGPEKSPGRNGVVGELGEVADVVVGEGEVVEGVAVGQRGLEAGQPPGLRVIGVGSAVPLPKSTSRRWPNSS